MNRDTRLRSEIERRRGVALAAVLLVGMGIMLLALGVIHLVRSEVAGLGAAEDLEQSRLLGRSAIRAFAVELDREREFMLRGENPRLPENIELFELDDGSESGVAVARLLPTGPGGTRLVAEAGRLDLNLIDAESLADTGFMTIEEARTVVAARSARPGARFDSVLDLLSLVGDVSFDPARIHGPLDEISILSLVDADEGSAGDRVLARLDADLGADVRGLADLLTVHAFEPDVCRDGTPRLVDGAASSDDVQSLALEDRDTVTLLEKFLGAGSSGDDTATAGAGKKRSSRNRTRRKKPEADTERPAADSSGNELLPRLRSVQSLELGDLGLAYDSVTDAEGGWRNGLLDINTASTEALLGIEGIGPELAAAIVARRESLPVDRRFDRLWPVAEGLVDIAEWDEIAPRITTRSLLWRMTIAVGFVRDDTVDESLEHPTVWEVVFDCGSQPPRVVELRDVTMLELVARIVAGDSDGLEFESTGAADGSAGLEREEGLFEEGPLFESSSLFDGSPGLFDDQPSLFEVDSLFDMESEPAEGSDLFDSEQSLFGPDDASGSEDPGETVDSGGASRARGPGGRWRPATGGR
ncbi:MAG: helix-hairpin-helix domain-containing protein [Phycisphaerales bacterium]|nr:helix-hairpin-helix domain-containing protein [Phycisphaerales bacterium]